MKDNSLINFIKEELKVNPPNNLNSKFYEKAIYFLQTRMTTRLCCENRNPNYLTFKNNDFLNKLYEILKQKFSNFILQSSIDLITCPLNKCIGINVPLGNFLGDNLKYNTANSFDSVGVFTQDGDYIGIANTESEYKTLWNSNSENQLIGEILSLSFNNGWFAKMKLVNGAVLPTSLKALRFWQVDVIDQTSVIVGTNDKILPTLVSTSTVLASSIAETDLRFQSYSDLNILVTPVYQDWMGDSTYLKRRNYRTLNTTLETVTIFHNDDTSPCGISSRGLDEGRGFSVTGSFSNLYGNFPEKTIAVISYTGSEDIFSNNLGFDNILNWTKLNPKKLVVSSDTAFAGGSADFDIVKLPSFTFMSNLESIGMWGLQNFSIYNFTKDNFPNLKSAAFGFIDENIENYNWSNFPNITKQLALQFTNASSDIGLVNFYNTFESTHTYTVSQYTDSFYPVSKPFLQIFGTHSLASASKRDLLRARGWSAY